MRKLGRTNIEVNEIGCGGIPLQRISQTKVNDMIEEMIRLGMNFIDTARGYSNSEILLGNAIEGKREKFIIATKSMARTYEMMKKDIEISLQNLKTSYIDLYQLHNVAINENFSGALDALEEAKNDGKIKHIGITTHSLEMLEKIVEDNYFDTIQFPYNIIEREAEQLFRKASKNTIGIIVMKPLAGGAISEADTALKFILKNENVSVVIPGMESIEQVRNNQEVINKELNSADFKIMKNIEKRLSNDFCRRCGYCMPCSTGINIPFVFLCEGYYTRYNLKEWALSRYSQLSKKSSDCIQCGKCEKKCPYGLKIIRKLKEVTKIMEE